MKDVTVVKVHVALGANLGDRHATLDLAMDALSSLAVSGCMPACSRRFESAAMAVPERPDEHQPDYLNAVARFGTQLSPHALLDALQGIEDQAGRDRGVGRWAARTLDLDLLLYGELELQDERLTLPHPGIAERAFVLRPLADLDDTLCIPGSVSVRSLLGSIDASGARVSGGAEARS